MHNGQSLKSIADVMTKPTNVDKSTVQQKLKQHGNGNSKMDKQNMKSEL